MQEIIQTVLGKIPAHLLGVCYAHEHVILERSYTTQRYPEFLINDVDKALVDLADFTAAGGRAMVDSMPCDSGRNVLKLAEVSRRAGIHLIAPTGLHLAKYYPEGHWSTRLSAEELAALFVADILEGIDENDYGGPQVQRTPHRAGVIKIASGLDGIDDHERKIFCAAAQAHLQTGAPILTHTEPGTAALDQVELLRDWGCDLSHVVLSHTDRQPDVVYHREILASGVKVEYDSAFRWKSGQGNPTRDLILALASEGYLSQIMLGMDAARNAYWRGYGGAPGMAYLLQDFWPQLKNAGLTETDFQTIFVQNPAESFAFSSVENV